MIRSRTPSNRNDPKKEGNLYGGCSVWDTGIQSNVLVQSASGAKLLLPDSFILKKVRITNPFPPHTMFCSRSSRNGLRRRQSHRSANSKQKSSNGTDSALLFWSDLAVQMSDKRSVVENTVSEVRGCGRTQSHRLGISFRSRFVLLSLTHHFFPVVCSVTFCDARHRVSAGSSPRLPRRWLTRSLRCVDVSLDVGRQSE